MKKLAGFIMLILILLATATDMDAQVRKRTTSKKKSKQKQEQISLMDKINPEIRFGNLGFFNGLAISTKLNAGFKPHKRFSFGAGGKLYYDQISVIGPDPSVTDLGGFLYGRGKITEEIYFQAEYSFMKYGADPPGFRIRNLNEPIKLNFPLVGLGYSSGFGKWRFGIELLYITNQTAQDIQGSVVEYWFGASYNF
jgi:hypothetical protein